MSPVFSFCWAEKKVMSQIRNQKAWTKYEGKKVEINNWLRLVLIKHRRLGDFYWLSAGHWICSRFPGNCISHCSISAGSSISIYYALPKNNTTPSIVSLSLQFDLINLSIAFPKQAKFRLAWIKLNLIQFDKLQ